MFARVVVVAVACTGCDAIFGVDEPSTIDTPPAVDAADEADAPAPDFGLIAHYPLDSVSGSRAVDIVGGRDLACFGTGCPIAIASDRGGALRFSGTQLLHGDGSGPLRTSGQFTVMAWVRISQSPDELMCPFNKLFDTEGDNSWQFCFTSTTMSFYTTSGPASVPIPLALNTWQHIALTWTGEEAQLFVDANPRTSAELQPPSFDDGRILVGHDEDSGAIVAPFTGDLDDLRIYTRALSSLEILSIVLPSS